MGWFAERKLRRARERFHKGYEWAAGALLRGNVTPDSIDEGLKSFGADDWSEWDDGVQCAADHWRARQRMLT